MQALLASLALHYPPADEGWVNAPHWTDVRSWWRYTTSDVAYILFVAVGLTVLRYQFQGFFESVGRRLQIKEARKYSESAWKLLFYASSTLWGAYILWVYDFEWVKDTYSMWTNVPFEAAGRLSTPRFIVWYYLYELAFYTHSQYAHVVIEVRRTDFVEMLAHHIVTFLLVGLSYTTFCYRVGIVILVLHDFSDVLMEIAKIASYSERALLGDCIFGVWVLSWFVLRLYFFPVYIIRSTWFESAAVIGQLPFHYLFNFMLVSLEVLHIIWTYMIFNFIWRKFFVKEIGFEDTRELDAKKKKK